MESYLLIIVANWHDLCNFYEQRILKLLEHFSIWILIGQKNIRMVRCTNFTKCGRKIVCVDKVSSHVIVWILKQNCKTYLAHSLPMFNRVRALISFVAMCNECVFQYMRNENCNVHDRVRQVECGSEFIQKHC